MIRLSISKTIFQFMAAISLAVMFFIPTHVSAGINQWTSIGPEGGQVTHMVIDPVTPTTLYRGQMGEVYSRARIAEAPGWS